LQSVEKNNGDLTAWLEYFTEGLAIELTKIKEKVEKISVDGKLRERLGGKPVMLSGRQLKIVEYIQRRDIWQTTDSRRFFHLYQKILCSMIEVSNKTWDCKEAGEHKSGEVRDG